MSLCLFDSWSLLSPQNVWTLGRRRMEEFYSLMGDNTNYPFSVSVLPALNWKKKHFWPGFRLRIGLKLPKNTEIRPKSSLSGVVLYVSALKSYIFNGHSIVEMWDFSTTMCVWFASHYANSTLAQSNLITTVLVAKFKWNSSRSHCNLLEVIILRDEWN